MSAGPVFSPEELREAIEAFGSSMVSSDQVGALEENAALFDFAVTMLVEVRPLDTPEEVLLADEESISGFAFGAINVARKITGSNKIGVAGAILIKHTPKPLHEKKKAQESALKNERLRSEIASLKEETDKTEKPFYKTAREMRRLSYKIGEENQRGTFLEQKIVELGRFSDREARFLAGIALEPYDMHRFAELKRAVGNSTNTWSLIAALGGGMPKDGLVSAIANLRELAESSPNKLADPALRPLATFVEAYELSEEEWINRLVSEMDMGIFEDAPELPIVPFTEDGHDTWIGSSEEKTEVKEEDFNEENITKDLKQTASALGFGIIPEPQRIQDFIDLHSKLVDQYGAEALKVYRTLRPHWHPLPWMVIEVLRENKPSVAVLEIAVYGNASYVISNEDWFGTLATRRKEARSKPGVKALDHVYNERSEIVEQTTKLYNEVRAKYDRR